ncbi:unnamed protein product [Polarella glacialis]|uniref:non-specific serine/threonine protein kinase n=2 Tax=Polarella glacialis TaxID=89957 RepID=A0A813EZV3_POLGL|nr:unnamed protein product [Polarella glacialis]
MSQPTSQEHFLAPRGFPSKVRPTPVLVHGCGIQTLPVRQSASGCLLRKFRETVCPTAGGFRHRKKVRPTPVLVHGCGIQTLPVRQSASGCLLRKFRETVCPTAGGFRRSGGSDERDARLRVEAISTEPEVRPRKKENVRDIAHRCMSLQHLVLSRLAGSDREHIRIVDFQHAMLGKSSMPSRTICGTMPYIAPEMALGGPYLPQSADCWSAGVVLLEMAGGLGSLVRSVGYDPNGSPATTAPLLQQFFEDPVSHTEALAVMAAVDTITVLEQLEQLMLPTPAERVQLANLLPENAPGAEQELLQHEQQRLQELTGLNMPSTMQQMQMQQMQQQLQNGELPQQMMAGFRMDLGNGVLAALNPEWRIFSSRFMIHASAVVIRDRDQAGDPWQPGCKLGIGSCQLKTTLPLVAGKLRPQCMLLLTLAAAAATAAEGSVGAVGAVGGTTPVQKVVTLLTKFTKDVEAEGKVEQKQFAELAKFSGLDTQIGKFEGEMQKSKEEHNAQYASYEALASSPSVSLLSLSAAPAPAYEYKSGDVTSTRKALLTTFKESKHSMDMDEVRAKSSFDKQVFGLSNEKKLAERSKQEKTLMKSQKDSSRATAQKVSSEEARAEEADEAFLDTLKADYEDKATQAEQRLSAGGAIALLSAAQDLKSPAVSVSAIQVQQKAHDFEDVLKTLADLIGNLEKQSTEDSSMKAFCDENIGTAATNRDSANAKMEGLAAQLDSTKSLRSQTNAEVEALRNALAANQAELVAGKLRAAEKAQNAVAEAKEAAAAVEYTVSNMKSFYEGAVLLHISAPSTEVAGAPEVAEGPYQGAQEKPKGVISMLEVLLTEFQTAEATVGAQEEKAAADFDKNTGELNDDSTAKSDETDERTGEVAALQGQLTSFEDDQKTTKEAYEFTVSELEKLRAMCVNGDESYETKKAKRLEQIASLKETLKMLEDMDKKF